MMMAISETLTAKLSTVPRSKDSIDQALGRRDALFMKTSTSLRRRALLRPTSHRLVEIA
jgi:hypothetical protein